VPGVRQASFAAGLTLVLVAVNSVAHVAEELFTAHMVPVV